MKRLIGLAVVAAAFHTYAQAPAVLLEACNAIQDPDKRLECLKAAAGTAKPDQSHAPVQRAFVGFLGNLQQGISYNSYASALDDLARQLAVFEREGGERGRPAAEKLYESLGVFKDAGRWWRTSISFYARRDNDLAYAGGLPFKQVGLEDLVGKYSLPVRGADLLGFNPGVPTTVAQQTMWKVGQELAEEGLKLLEAPPAFATVPAKETPATLPDEDHSAHGGQFKAIVAKCQAQVNARPVDRVMQLEDGDWMRNVSNPSAIAYDIRRTDSLETPFAAILRLGWSERSIRTQTREELAVADINTGSEFAGVYEIRYGYQDGRWKTTQGLVTEQMRLPHEDHLSVTRGLMTWSPQQLAKQGWFSDCIAFS